MASYYDRQNAVDDFDEYDPHPYNGGCDLSLTYGRSLPPSHDTCYPPSTPGNDDSSAFQYGSESSPYGSQSQTDNYGAENGIFSRPKPKPKLDHDHEDYGGRPRPQENHHQQPGYGEELKKPTYGYGEEDHEYHKFGSSGYTPEEEYGRPSSSWNRPTPPPQTPYQQSGYGEECKKPSYGYGEEEIQEPKFVSSGYGAGEDYGEKPRPSSGWNRPNPAPEEYHQQAGYGEEWKKPSYGYGEEESQGAKFGSGGYGGGEEYGRPQRPSYYQQEKEEEIPKFERPSYYKPDQEEGYERRNYGDDHEKQKHGRHHHHHHSYDDE